MSATYTPDPIIVTACRWARARGLRNHQFSAIRVGDHAHVINCIGDMNTLDAIVISDPNSSYGRVEQTSHCTVCHPAPVASSQPAKPSFTTVTGTRWIQGVEDTVTGFPVHQGLTLSDTAFVTLLTEAGALVRDVRVPLAALDGVRVKPLTSNVRDGFLRRVAETNIGGAGSRCLAELTMRERDRVEAEERNRRARIERSRRDAARLLMEVGR